MENWEFNNNNKDGVDEEWEFLFQKKPPISRKLFVKDIDLPRKDFLMLFLIIYSLIFLFLIQISIQTAVSSIDQLDYNAWQYLFYGIIIGLIIAIYKIDKIRDPLKFIKDVIEFTFITSLFQLFFTDIQFLLIFSILIFINSVLLILALLTSFKVFLLKTTILERGRVWSYLFILTVCGILLLFFSALIGLLILIPFILIILTIFLLRKNKQDNIILIKPPKKREEKTGLKNYYILFICLGVTDGFATPLNVSLRLISDLFAGNIVIILTIVILFIVFSTLTMGIIFDFFGRLSFIILILAFSNYLNIFQLYIPDLSAAAISSVFIGVLMAVPLLVGDVAQRNILGKSVTVSYVIFIISMIVGQSIRNIITSMYGDDPFAADLLRGTTSLACMACFIVLLTLKETLPRKEQEWKDYLLHIYIIYESGVLLNEYAFKQEDEVIHPDLISGGIIGLITLLQEIVKGKKQVKTIDHGDRKLMFSANSIGNVVFVLVVREELIVFRKKLDSLIETFDKLYKEKVEEIENAGVETKQFSDLKTLILKYFGG
jgi:MFS family permease